MKGRSFIKVLFALVCFSFFAMQYWSSLLVEADLKAVRADLKQLHAETMSLGQKVRLEFPATKLSEADSLFFTGRSNMRSDYPNLLTEDKYFTQRLPALLGDAFRPQGILKEALVGRPGNLHPFNAFKDVSLMLSMCTVRVADLQFGKYETFTPDMALKLESRPRPDHPDVEEYWIHLRDDVYWQPIEESHFPNNFALSSFFLRKHKVTAHDFKFYFDAIMNPHLSEAKAVSLRTYYKDIEEFIVLDDYTFIIRWKPYTTQNKEGQTLQKIKYTSLGLTTSLCPLPRFIYQYYADGQKIIEEDEDSDTYRQNSVWAQNFAEHWAKNVIVSCGPYLFDGMNDEGIKFKRNSDHYNPYAVLTEGIHYRFKENFDSVWQDFKAGKIDLCTLSPNQLSECDSFLESEEYKLQKQKGMGIQKIDYVDLSYFYLGWNLVRPYFSTSSLRQAMTMAIDRNRIIEQNLNQMALSISGPFLCLSPSNDPTISPLSYNPDEARKILDREGWIDLDGDGIRDKIIDGKKVPFRFKLHYFVKSHTTKVIAEYIATALRDIGIDCQLRGVDLADLSRQFDDKSFDAILMGWKSGVPPEDPRQLWHSSGAREKGSSNAIGFADEHIDRLIEELSYEYDREKRLELYHEFHQRIHEQAPYTFLYTPKVRLLHREYVHNLFIPRDRPDLIPNAEIPEPSTQVIWLSKKRATQ